MTSERMPWMALVAFLTITVYFLDGLLSAGFGGAMARGGVVLAGLAAAWWAPRVLRELYRIWRRPPALKALRTELSVQKGATGVAEVLVARLRELSGASAVALYLGDERLAADPEPPYGEPAHHFPLGEPDRPIGEVRCHGKVRNVRRMRHMLRFGTLALQNALLAEQASVAERARSQAQAQRDLQRRLTWTVTTQLCVLLDETRARLEAIRLCARTLPAGMLMRDLDLLSERLRQMEGFVQENLRNANSLQVPVSPKPLARFPRPR